MGGGCGHRAGARGGGGGARDVGVGRQGGEAELGPLPGGPLEKFAPWLAGTEAEEAGLGDTRQETGAKRGGRTNRSETLRPGNVPRLPSPRTIPASQPSSHLSGGRGVRMPVAQVPFPDGGEPTRPKARGTRGGWGQPGPLFSQISSQSSARR